MKHMTRQVFLEILDKQLFAALFCISVAYLFAWFTVFNLGFLVLNVKINTRKIIPLILIGSLYSFWAKQLLTLPLAGRNANFNGFFIMDNHTSSSASCWFCISSDPIEYCFR